MTIIATTVTTDDGLPVALRGILDSVSEAANLPADLGAPNQGESLSDLHQRLLVTRSAMTRVGELAGELTLLSGRVKRILIDRKGDLDDQEAEVVSARRALTEDYSSAKERNARIAAKTLNGRRRVRQAEKLLADVEAALFYTRDRHRELDRAVRDIDTRLRILAMDG